MENLWIVNDKGKVIIPDGYRYCEYCNAITPHEKIKNSFSRYECKICGESSVYGENCPNCGWVAPEDPVFDSTEKAHLPGCHCDPISFPANEGEDEEQRAINRIYNQMWGRSEESLSDQIVREFFKKEKSKFEQDLGGSILYKKGWNRLDKLEEHFLTNGCGCPEYVVYRNVNHYNFWGRSVISMDCMNAQEWGWTIRCPICGEEFDYSDGNC